MGGHGRRSGRAWRDSVCFNHKDRTFNSRGVFQMMSRELPPHPAVLMESLRDIGYSMKTALADILDNSIAAGATTIDILMDPMMESPCIGIIDNGSGMDSEELLEAMRPGSKSPLLERDSRDLGRFGLGLKTASFSQCRRLTVLTRRNGTLSCARWDLDYVVERNAWLVEIPEDLDTIPYAEDLSENGTLVVWEKMDRVGASEHPGSNVEATRQLDEACRHIELVFHRFLAGAIPKRKVCIHVNGTALSPVDPFCSSHDATNRGPVEIVPLGGKNIEVQAFTLPHHSKVSADEWERNGRKEGYIKNQGFYVYRANRLIISGTWFGLMKQTELTKLARVRIDTPNSLDRYWKIDVKKASAQPPYTVREHLRKIIEPLVAQSRRVYTQRGARQVSEDRCPVWVRFAEHGEVRYEINFQHPVVQRMLDAADDETKVAMRAMLHGIQAAIPIDTIHADTAECPQTIARAPLSEEDMRSLLEVTLPRLVSVTGDRAKAVEFILTSEPFTFARAMAETILRELE